MWRGCKEEENTAFKAGRLNEADERPGRKYWIRHFMVYPWGEATEEGGGRCYLIGQQRYLRCIIQILSADLAKA